MRKVTVLGAGVSGLTCALSFLRAGHKVTIRARATHPHITSSVAAAIWFPYEAFPKERVVGWALRSYEIFRELSQKPVRSGVRMADSLQVCDRPFERPDWAPRVDGYREVAAPLLPSGFADGYVVTIPIIQTPIYLPYLMEQVRTHGAEILVDDGGISSFSEITDSEVLINCTGLGARELCKDAEVYPIKGQVVRIANPGISSAVCDDDSPAAIGYVIPRDDDCILGGTAVKGDWSTEADESETQKILEKCALLDPAVRNPDVLEVKCGLRPGRPTVRLEKEILGNGQCVIHNYGHGGAGYTLSWGCAEEVLQLAAIDW